MPSVSRADPTPAGPPRLISSVLATFRRAQTLLRAAREGPRADVCGFFSPLVPNCFDGIGEKDISMEGHRAVSPD